MWQDTCNSCWPMQYHIRKNARLPYDRLLVQCLQGQNQPANKRDCTVGFRLSSATASRRSPEKFTCKCQAEVGPILNSKKASWMAFNVSCIQDWQPWRWHRSRKHVCILWLSIIGPLITRAPGWPVFQQAAHWLLHDISAAVQMKPKSKPRAATEGIFIGERVPKFSPIYYIILQLVMLFQLHICFDSTSSSINTRRKAENSKVTRNLFEVRR